MGWHRAFDNDALVFTAGVGENNAACRAAVTEGLEYMGVKIDPELNKQRGELDISAPDAAVHTLVIPTDEEMMIALDAQRLTK